MADHLYKNWCDLQTTTVSAGRSLHLLAERSGSRSGVQAKLLETVLSHYEDPSYLAERAKRVGFPKAAKMLYGLLPKTKKARSGHMGEILAAEVVPAVLPSFHVPLKRLRWLDGRESALRGEDIIGITSGLKQVRFLKGESKSGVAITPAVVAKARQALKANGGRPSQHAMGFIMHRLRDTGNDGLALVFEEYMIAKTIALDELVHLVFAFSGNDASGSLQDDLKAYTGKIEQHSVNLRIDDHQTFINSVYKK